VASRKAIGAAGGAGALVVKCRQLLSILAAPLSIVERQPDDRFAILPIGGPRWAEQLAAAPVLRGSFAIRRKPAW
jgi:hypothetical protein